MGLQKPYTAKEARQIMSGRLYQDGDVVHIQHPRKMWLFGVPGVVEACSLSTLDRGERIYRVRIGRSLTDVQSFREAEITSPP